MAFKKAEELEKLEERIETERVQARKDLPSLIGEAMLGPIGLLTKKTAIRQFARGARDVIELAKMQLPSMRRTSIRGLKGERREIAKTMARMPGEIFAPVSRVGAKPRISPTIAEISEKGLAEGKIPLEFHLGRQAGDPSSLQVVAHELAGHVEALTRKEPYFKHITHLVEKAGITGPHEEFAYKVGELIEAAYGRGKGPIPMKEVRALGTELSERLITKYRTERMLPAPAPKALTQQARARKVYPGTKPIVPKGLPEWSGKFERGLTKLDAARDAGEIGSDEYWKALRDLAKESWEAIPFGK
jgi:hypothetical protein